MKISIVTTLYFSQDYVQEFYRRISASVEEVADEYEILFVNDGSPDRSLDAVLDIQKADPKVVAIDLSRNFGHHRALMTGLQHARGDYVFMTDSDLEEAPELLKTYWQELSVDPEVDVIYGVQRRRKGGLFEKLTGKLWYRFFSLLSRIDYPENTLTSRLMSRRYVQAVLEFTEKELELWGVFMLAGFKQRAVPAIKGHKGSTTYTLARKLQMAVDSITSFSAVPLIAIFVLGLCLSAGSILVILYLSFNWIVYAEVPEGWTSTLVSLWFVGGLLMFCVGIIGLYISKMFLEVKNRPLSIVRHVYRSNCEGRPR